MIANWNFADGTVFCTPYGGILSDFGYVLYKITTNLSCVLVIELKALWKLTILSIMDIRGRKIRQWRSNGEDMRLDHKIVRKRVSKFLLRLLRIFCLVLGAKSPCKPLNWESTLKTLHQTDYSTKFLTNYLNQLNLNYSPLKNQ